MLVLSRKEGQQVLIGDKVEISVVRIDRKTVRLGFTAASCRSTSMASRQESDECERRQHANVPVHGREVAAVEERVERFPQQAGFGTTGRRGEPADPIGGVGIRFPRTRRPADAEHLLRCRFADGSVGGAPGGTREVCSGAIRTGPSVRRHLEARQGADRPIHRSWRPVSRGRTTRSSAT